MGNNWNVKINNVPGSLLDDIFIWRDFDRTGIEVMQFGPDGVMIKRYERDGTIDAPSMRLDSIDARSLVQAFIKLGREQGFKDADESKTAGKLEATERHLDDMRTLVFKKD